MQARRTYAAVDDGIRHERFAAPLNPIEKCLVEFVEVPLGRLLAERGPQIGAARTGTS